MARTIKERIDSLSQDEYDDMMSHAKDIFTGSATDNGETSTFEIAANRAIRAALIFHETKERFDG